MRLLLLEDDPLLGDSLCEYLRAEGHDVLVLDSADGARSQPLLLMITTAGNNVGGPCYTHQVELQKVLEGVVADETRFGIIYGIDIDPACAAFDGIDAQVRIGSQADPDFLRRVVQEMGGVDVVLADTAGRLPTQLHLMDELKKITPIVKVVTKVIEKIISI